MWNKNNYKKFALVSILLLPICYADAAVLIDSSSFQIVARSTSINWSHTTSATDGLLIVGVSHYGQSAGIASVTYGGTALTQWSSASRMTLRQPLQHALLGRQQGSST